MQYNYNGKRKYHGRVLTLLAKELKRFELGVLEKI